MLSIVITSKTVQMKNKNILFLTGLLSMIILVLVSCRKDEVTVPNPPLPGVQPSASFVEEFDSVGNLTKKGWVFKNNSFPIGQSGWRQGRYEAATGVQYKFVAPVSVYGFPAYSANNSPNDFISCDVTAGNDVNGSADINAWLISPQLPMRNGDSIIFYTRAVFDAAYSVYTKDRMQVRANFTDGTANVGGSSATSVGSFTRVLLDINPNYLANDPAGNTPAVPGYPRSWTRYKIVLSGVPRDSIRTGRFAFRYMAVDAGIFGGTSGANYPSVVGVDSLAFGRK
jgi:hypothetical protein